MPAKLCSAYAAQLVAHQRRLILRIKQGDHQVFPRPYRDVPEAVESGGLAGRMDAAWTERDGAAERIREQNQQLDALDAPSVIPFYIYSPLQLGFAIYCVHCVHRRGFCWAFGLHRASTPRPGASASLEPGLPKSSARPVLPVRLAHLTDGRASRTLWSARGGGRTIPAPFPPISYA